MTAKEKLSIHICHPGYSGQPARWERVKGEVLRVKGYEDWPMIVHQHNRYSDWKVSEGRSGSYFGIGATKAEAIRDAKHRLKGLGRPVIEALTAYWTKRYGPPPADDGNARE